MPYKPGCKPGPGRPRGMKNKTTVELREMIEKALMKAGGVKYLRQQAIENPAAFLALVGRCLPKDIQVTTDSKIVVNLIGVERGRTRDQLPAAGADIEGLPRIQ